MRLMISLLPVLLVVAPVHADTTVQGTIATTTWRRAHSPYRVQDTLRIPPRHTLTI